MRGAGKGCIASNNTIFAEAKVANYSSGCRSLSTLVERGHLVREKRGRATVYRVPFSADDRFADDLHGCNISPPENGCEAASNVDAIGCERSSESRRNLPKTDLDYSPPSGELDSVETGRINSVETAQLAPRAARGGENDPFHKLALQVGKQKRNGAQAPASRGVSLWAKLLAISPDWHQQPVKSQLCHLERAFKAVGGDPAQIDGRDLKELSDYLFSVTDASDETAIIHHANRLEESLMVF